MVLASFNETAYRPSIPGCIYCLDRYQTTQFWPEIHTGQYSGQLTGINSPLLQSSSPAKLLLRFAPPPFNSLLTFCSSFLRLLFLSFFSVNLCPFSRSATLFSSSPIETRRESSSRIWFLCSQMATPSKRIKLSPPQFQIAVFLFKHLRRLQSSSPPLRPQSPCLFFLIVSAQLQSSLLKPATTTAPSSFSGARLASPRRQSLSRVTREAPPRHRRSQTGTSETLIASTRLLLLTRIRPASRPTTRLQDPRGSSPPFAA